MEKIFNQKIFNNFVWTPLGSRVNIYINICLQVHFKVSALCSLILIPLFATGVNNTVWQICRQCPWNRWQFATGVNNTSGTGTKICRQCRWYRWKICRRCRWHRWCALTCEYLRELSKKFVMTLMLFSGAWGKVIHEKTWSKKSRDAVPFLSTLFLQLCSYEGDTSKIAKPYPDYLSTF
jgi:hypothetical protein